MKYVHLENPPRWHRFKMRMTGIWLLLWSKNFYVMRLRPDNKADMVGVVDEGQFVNLCVQIVMDFAAQEDALQQARGIINPEK